MLAKDWSLDMDRHARLSAFLLLSLFSPLGLPDRGHTQQPDPRIQEMIDQISDSLYTSSIQRLQDLYTRYELSDSIVPAGQWLYDQFLARGYSDVVFDSFTWVPTVVDTTILSRNIIATKLGMESPDSIVLLGGHYDSIGFRYWEDPYVFAPGADDNASGTAGVLEIARILQPYSFAKTLAFACFAGEEVGMGGSSHYASRLDPEGKTLRFALVLDEIAYQESPYSFETIVDTDLRYVADALRTAELGLVYSDRLQPFLSFNYVGSDHIMLGLHGSAIDVSQGAVYRYPLAHSEWDVLDSLSIPYATEILKMALASIVDVAQPLPVGISEPNRQRGPALTSGVTLRPNCPNPFNPSTTIPFDVPGISGIPEHVSLRIFDIRGTLVRTLMDSQREPGSYGAVWDGRDDRGLPVTSGVYICTVRSGEQTASRKLTLLR